MRTTPDQLRIRGIDPLEGKRFLVRKRDGRIEEFNEGRILLAIESAFRAHHECLGEKHLPENLLAAVQTITEKVVDQVLSRAVRGGELEVERIQDVVEDQLMKAGHFEVARCYILYRERRRIVRAEREGRGQSAATPKTSATPLASAPAVPHADPLRDLYAETFAKPRPGENIGDLTRRYFDAYLNEAEYFQLLTPEMLEFDAATLACHLAPERDKQIKGEGLALLRARYLLRDGKRALETPQYFWMRLAMGLALRDTTAEARAAEFYEAFSTLRLIPSENIMLHAGSRNASLRTAADGPGIWRELWERDVLDSVENYSPGRKGFVIRDLFLQRVRAGSDWLLFDPVEAAELSDQSGKRFDECYHRFEEKARKGGLRFAKSLPARELWREVLSAGRSGAIQFLFKDRINAAGFQYGGAYPAAAINLAAHVADDGSGLNTMLLRQTIKTAVRLLDNAVDLDMGGPTAKEGRAITLGLAGFAEALGRFNAALVPEHPAEWAGQTMETVAYHAYLASAELAAERGPMGRETPRPIEHLPEQPALPWETVRAAARQHGLRNGLLTGDFAQPDGLRLAGLSPSPAIYRSVDCIAAMQRWSDGVWMHIAEEESARIAGACMGSWEAGVALVELRQVQKSKRAKKEMELATAH